MTNIQTSESADIIRDHRTRKAIKLALTAQKAGAVAADLAFFDSEGWERLATVAVVRKPSQATRELTADLLALLCH